MDPYSTSTGERESRSFREEPWHLHLHYVSSLSMHSALPTCQPPFMVRSLQLVEVRPYAEEEEEVLPNLAAVCASIYHTIHTLTLILTLNLALISSYLTNKHQYVQPNMSTN